MRLQEFNRLRRTLHTETDRRDVVRGLLAAFASLPLSISRAAAQNDQDAEDDEEAEAEPRQSSRGRTRRERRNIATACFGGQTLCDTYCVDTNREVSDCGACGNQCPGQQACVAGNCQCQNAVCELWAVETPYFPVGIAATAHDELVTTTRNNLIVTYDAAGRYVRYLGGFGNGLGQLHDPKGIAIDGAGVIYVADRDNRRIQRIAPSGEIAVWELEDAPRGIAVATSGVIYATFGNQVHRLSSTGQVEYAWGPGGDPESLFARPAGVAIGGDSAIYVVDELGNTVTRFIDGGPGAIHQDWSVGDAGKDPGAFNVPWGVAVDAGRVFVADVANQRVQALSVTDGSVLFAWHAEDHPGSLWNPKGIAVGSTGLLHVTSDKKIYTFELGDV